MSNEINKFIEIIKEAIDNIDECYYKLPTTYEKLGIVRERVFCYELYHQIRKRMEDNSPLIINGEIDKRGHRGFKEKDRKNPDFVFHIPGEHKYNTIVIEVKGKIISEDVKKDFETLSIFIEDYYYKKGVFILYNNCMKDFIDKCQSIIKYYKSKENISKKILIICKKNKNCTCEVKLLSQF